MALRPYLCVCVYLCLCVCRSRRSTCSSPQKHTHARRPGACTRRSEMSFFSFPFFFFDRERSPTSADFPSHMFGVYVLAAVGMSFHLFPSRLVRTNTPAPSLAVCAPLFVCVRRCRRYRPRRRCREHTTNQVSVCGGLRLGCNRHTHVHIF